MTSERASLAQKHQEEWQRFRSRHLEPCLASGDDAQARFIKTVADTLRIAQDAERRALLLGEGLDDDGSIEIEWSA